MNRKHALIVAAALGLAALAGMVALTRTLHLGGAARTRVPQAQIVRRSRQLDRIEASLRRELARRRRDARPGPRPARHLRQAQADRRHAAPPRGRRRRAGRAGTR